MENKKRKDALLYNLAHETFCRLAPSKIHGIGVFAIRDIPKDTDPFQSARIVPLKAIYLSEKEVKRLPSAVVKLISDFVPERYVPETGMNMITLDYYLNHDNKCNVDHVSSKTEKSDYMGFRTNRKIYTGEELTIDYNFVP